MKKKNGALRTLLIIFGLAICAANVWCLLGNPMPERQTEPLPLTQEQREQLTLELTQALAGSGSECVSGLAAKISFAVSPGEPGEIESAETVQALSDVFSSNRAVGASVAVIKDGRVSWHYEYGHADLESETPVVMDTKFRVASLSKVVTTMTAMTLVDSGKISLDQNIADIFGYSIYNPRYPNVPVTVRMLMTHTSGLKDQSPNYTGALRWNLVGRKRYGSYPPGGRHTYSNYGMGTLGAAIECASGQKLYDYSREVFFAPMGIDASFEGSLISDKSLIASCYFRRKLDRSAESLAAPFTAEPLGETVHLGAGNLIISAVDYARLMTVLVNDGLYNGRRYLSEQSVADMQTVSITAAAGYKQCLALRYAQGLIGSHDMYYHNGNAYGVLSFACYDPAQRSGVVVVTSGSHENTDNGVYEVCRDIAELCYANLIDT